MFNLNPSYESLGNSLITINLFVFQIMGNWGTYYYLCFSVIHRIKYTNVNKC